MRTLAFFNNKGGVGKTSLAYHVSWMLKEMGHNILSVDLDPQANLTGMFMSESRLEEIFNKKETVFHALRPLTGGRGDIQDPVVFSPIQDLEESLKLLPGDLELSSTEGDFSASWTGCLAREERAFRVTTAFHRLIAKAGEKLSASWAVIDMGPNLGAINRAVLIACDYLVFPLGPDLFSFQGLKNVGAFLNKWRKEWRDRKTKGHEADLDFSLPEGRMQPIGYIMMKHSIRHDRPVRAYQNWMNRMPGAYKKFVLNKTQPADQTEGLLAHLKDYRSLMSMAQEKNKPMFYLKPGDGAIGAHYQAAQSCYQDFKDLTEKIVSVIHKSSE